MLDKKEEHELQLLKEEKQVAAPFKQQSETLQQIMVQPVISDLDREHPEQIPPREPQFVTRMTQIISESLTYPEKPHNRDSHGVTTDCVQEPFDHSTELRPVLELMVINLMPAIVRPSDTLNQ